MRLNRFAIALILGIATALPNGGYGNSGGNGNGNGNPVGGGGGGENPSAVPSPLLVLKPFCLFSFSPLCVSHRVYPRPLLYHNI
jgi:hypothetical protein